MVGEPGGVGVVFLDPQLRFVIQQSVEDIRRVSDRRVDHLNVVAAMLIRQMRVKQRARLITVARINVTGRLAPAAGAEPLPVGGRGGTFAPLGGERQSVLVVDEFGERLGIGLVAHMPARQPRQFRKARPRAGFGHLGKSEIRAVGQNGRQQ